MDFQKAIELIEKSEPVGLVLPEAPDFDALASAEVVAWMLKRRGKNFGLLTKFSREKIEEVFPILASSSTLPREFIVALDTAQSPVSQLRYEKKDGRIEVVFSPTKSPIKKEDISFGEGKTPCDLIIAMGVETVDSLPAPDIEPEAWSEKPIINIDVSERNKHYGEVNLVGSSSAVSEITYNLFLALENEPPPREIAKLMLAAILQKSDNFTSSSVSPDTLLISSELMRLGATLEEARRLISSAQPLALLQLMGRASVRSRLSENQGVLWTFLTADDFEKTGRTGNDAASVLEYLEKTFPPHELTVLLSQEEKNGNVEATLAGEKPALEILASSAGGTFQSPYLKLNHSFQNFREAEEKILSLLKEVL